MEGQAISARIDGRTQAAPYDPTMTTIDNIDGFVHTIADTPPWRGQSKSIRLVGSGPIASPSSSSSSSRNTGWSTNSWNGWEQPRPKPNAAQPDGRPPWKP